MSGARIVMPIATRGKMASHVITARMCTEGMWMEGGCAECAAGPAAGVTAALSAGAETGIWVLKTFSNYLVAFDVSSD